MRQLWMAVVASLGAVAFTDHSGVSQSPGVHLALVARSSARQLGGLGPVGDAVQDGRGRIFLIDGERTTVLAADSQLRLLGALSSGDQSPELFRQPVALAVLADGRVAVLDRILETIRILEVRDGGRQLVAVGAVPLRMTPEWVCALSRNQVLVYGLHRGMQLHVVDLRRGRIVRSFAAADTSLVEGAQEQHVRGRLACDLSHDEAVVTSRFFPMVQAFRISDGRETWTDTLRPFRPLTVTIRGRGMSMSAGRDGYSRVLSAMHVGRCRLIQATFAGRTDHGADTTISYVNLGSAGRWRPAEIGTPLLFHLRGDRVLAASARDSTVSVFRLSVDGCGSDGRSR